MACPKVLGEFSFRIRVASTQEFWEPVGRFFNIVGASSVDVAMTVSRCTGHAQVIPAVTTAAALESAAGTPAVASGSWATAAATTHHTYTLSTVTDKFLARVGLLAKLSGATPGYVEGRVSILLGQCALMVGSRTIDVPAALATATPSYYLVGRVPALGADDLRAAIVAMDAKDLEYLFYVRGVNDPDSPGTFTALNGGTWTALADGNSAVCHADASVSGVTPSSYHQLDVMVALRLKSGGSAPKGVVRVGVGMSYA